VRVSPDLLLELFAGCEAKGLRLGLYGGSPETLDHFTAFLRREYPRLQLACAISPPFRPPTPEEDARYTKEIREAGVQLLLVGIGCPKQERWVAAHRDHLPCVMFGVGAAFDLLGGRTRNAPAWMRDIGLEWVYRLLLEPRRLWRRYIYHNPRFVALFARQLAAERPRASRGGRPADRNGLS
jgi:N-acetylglucosaminyldiphosphoundecaprenol N-acetyl-beta-D-mannosaminyltransferase